MTLDTDLKTKLAGLQAEATAARLQAGKPRFPAAWRASQRQYAKQHRFKRPGSWVKRLLHSIPLIGPLGRLLVTLVRLPARLGQMDVEVKELKELQRQIGAQFSAQLRELREELLQQNHERHESTLKLRQHVEQLKADFGNLQSQWHIALEQVEQRLVKPRSREDSAILSDNTLSGVLLDDFYWNFEEHFRGSPALIAERLQGYVPHLQQLAKALPSLPLLDIGCGRGEWLKIVNEQGIPALGVDLNARMVRECAAADLTVTLGDALLHLRGLETNSLAAVTGFHIVEHLPFIVLMALFQEAYRVVSPGGFVLFETPNPENIVVGSCTFYTDPTHKNPIPPSALGFMLSSSGFKRQECLRLREEPLRNPPSDPEVAAVIARFHVGTDYAIVGFKDRLEV